MRLPSTATFVLRRSRVVNMIQKLFVMVSMICATGLPGYSRAQIDRNKPGAGLAFAYANTAGTRLLTLQNDEEIKPTFLSTAVCSEAREAPIRYLQFQKGNERSNGRQSQWNLPNDEGHLFEILGP